MECILRTFCVKVILQEVKPWCFNQKTLAVIVTVQ